MSGCTFKPTPEQEKVIYHDGSAFITACPGAGKTRVMVERARHLLRSSHYGQGVAFLSFTKAAVSELEDRLRREALLGSPVFPHFIGTFDSFIWQFIVSPFGIPDMEAVPRLIPDKDKREVQPFEKAQSLPLSCFDRATGKIDAAATLRLGFDESKKTLACLKAYETAAFNMQARFRERGELDFDDARDIVLRRLNEADFSKRLAIALSARFHEIIVDEAQDCNPADLDIIHWFRNAGISIKVICDPHQSIYGFRGGVTDQLFNFADTFSNNNRLGLNGNFRSSENICKAIINLRAVEFRNVIDEAIGELKNEQALIYILSYSGNSVTASIGKKFINLLNELGIDIPSAPVLAATKGSAANAIGQPLFKGENDLTLRLAEAVSNFHFAFESGNQKSALEKFHAVFLELQGHLPVNSYHQYRIAHDLKPDEWRPQMLQLLRAFRYDPEIYADADAWHNRAKELLKPYLPPNGQSISQKLKKNKDIADVLRLPPAEYSPAKTIHSVKGMEFPAVCVVTTITLKGILDYLETGKPADKAEDARKLYVAASRAQRLLAIAAPKSQSARLTMHIGKSGAAVTLVDI